MPIEIDVDGRDLAAMVDAVGATEKIAYEALVSSIKRTQKWLSTRVGRELAKANKLPVKAVRARIRLNKISKHKLNARIWIGLNALAARRVGKPRQTKTGVTVGKYKFPHAFITPNQSVVRRKGKSRFPIETVTIDISDRSERVLRNHAWPDAQDYLLTEFTRQLKYRMSKVK